ncbi:MAG: hydrogenase maturation protease [Actinomycetota bacterium]|nr:hydrogenase maturation protease [Actinomycetota bacterium]
MTVLIGGVGQLYQGDHDLGRLAVERLWKEDLGREVVVEDLHYGAVAVAQRLQDLRPDSLLLIGAAERQRPPGTVKRRWIAPSGLEAAETQQAVEEAVTGYVTIDLVVEVAQGLGALPSRTVVVEVEPARTQPSEELSPEAQAGLERALELVRREVQWAALLELTDQLRPRLEGNRLELTPALSVLRDLLDELQAVERTGNWGSTFVLSEELRYRIGQGQTGEGMDHLDWSLWWALIEELDRLKRLDASY